ncbi:ABC transporter permease [Streptomyces sp. Wb2n-11]|uniref:ABC transporter permease n=1 Tax=Streptomyces sp. Wb2n-11 TaxID=1030533 RepID=UPI000B2AC881|nr:ABC transporter permease [Streptomyces sp. Wb2n-11]
MTKDLRRAARTLLRIGVALPAVVVIALAIAGPWLVGTDPDRIVAAPYAGAGDGLLFGADSAGRDVWARVLTGGRALILVPVLAVLVTTVLGTAVGMVAGYLGGVVDAVVSRLDGAILALPPILVLLVLLHGWGYSAAVLVLVVVITGASFVSRIARAATVQVMRQGYVEHAVGLGESVPSVLAREILPNIVRPILADAGTRLAIAVALTSAAGFLGFGADEPNWGAMISENIEGVTLTPWAVVVPAVCLGTLAVAANLGMDRLAARTDR